MTARRRVLKAALAAIAAFGASRKGRAVAAPAEMRVPDTATTETFDFETRGIEGWTSVSGQWAVEEMAGAPSGKRANALEDNFRLYVYDGGRRQLATARVKTPALGQWHTVRLVVVGDRVQAWLDGALHLDHRDARLGSGRVGLWTKADSITAFDDLTIRGTKGR